MTELDEEDAVEFEETPSKACNTCDGEASKSVADKQPVHERARKIDPVILKAIENCFRNKPGK